MRIPWGSLLPVVSLIIGWGLSSLSGWWKDKRVSKREREIRLVERREAKRVRRNEFQRESLLGLQEAAASLMKAAIETYRHNWAGPQEQGTLKLSSVDVDRDYLNAETQIGMFLHRVHDQDVRNACNAFRLQCLNSTGPFPDRDQARVAVNECSGLLSRLNHAVGNSIGELDALDEQA